MILVSLVLTLSAATFFFYFQVTCQKILHRQFDREYFQSVAKVMRLEFPALRKSLEECGAPVDYSRLRVVLKGDFRALTFLLKDAPNASPGYSKEEQLLVLYFHWQFLSLAVRRLVKARENKAILTLTSVLQYFANVVGQRAKTVGFGNLIASD
jgi:hypothetical protein